MSKKIHEYDLDGHYIKSYNSIMDAAKDHGRDEKALRSAATGTTVSSANRLWSFQKENSYFEINSTVHKFVTDHGIDPAEVVKARVSQRSNGDELVSIEIKKVVSLSDEEKSSEIFVRNKKQLQRKQDELRVVNKHFREQARVENALTALNEELVRQLSSEDFKTITYDHVDKEGPVLIVQVTDTHFNELVNLPDNAYDFVIGGKRLQKYAHKIKKIAEAYKVSKIVVAFTGDIINSDRRLDEIMNMATNRSKAALLATQLLHQFLQDINRVANLSIVGVSGNESRIKDEYGMSALAMSDNYDFLIYNMLKLLFKDKKGIEFISGDPVEQVINVNGSNILITHGTGFKEGQGFMQQVFGKYAAKGILLDYAIFGHVHFTNITDIYSRSGSLVGNNTYSDRGLNLVTKASQVLHIIERDGTIDNIKVGLQYINDYKGYKIENDENAYNSQLSNNVVERETIVQIVI
jgi:predicted phosphodiesterase